MVSSLLAIPVARYIAINQRRLSGNAVPIPLPGRARMEGYFSAEILDAVRIVERDPLPIPNPPFANAVRRLGLHYPDLSLTLAITFGDLIATRAPMSANLLFHELVHVVQYRQLGIPAFARQYVRGLLVHRAYERIPLEAHAFQLEARFQFDRRPFCVESEVARLL